MTFINLLTVQNYGGDYGEGLATFTTSEAFILTIIIALVGFFVQARLQ